VVTEAGTSALTTYSLARDGSVTEIGSVTNGLAALCWVTSAAGRYDFGTDAGPIDLAASPDGSSLFVAAGGDDMVDAFTVKADGSLTPVGSVSPELPGHSGLEGIVVT
jgi:DNA-binding beta-propeller fold protein YncE